MRAVVNAVAQCSGGQRRVLCVCFSVTTVSRCTTFLTHHEHHLGELEAVGDEAHHLLVSSDLMLAGHAPSGGLRQQGRQQ